MLRCPCDAAFATLAELTMHVVGHARIVPPPRTRREKREWARRTQAMRDARSRGNRYRTSPDVPRLTEPAMWRRLEVLGR